MKIVYSPFSKLWLVLLLLSSAACSKEDMVGSACTSPYVAPRSADAYNFPVLPGTEAWKKLQSGQAMVDACQIPAAKLSAISTPGLLSTCLNYPLLGNILAYNSLQRGTRVQLESFNGFDELRKRPEAASLLLERYQRMGPTCLPEGQVQRGNYSFSFTYVEMILAQDEYLAQLSADERRSLLREALTKYIEKKPLAESVYSDLGLATSVFVMARIMQAEQYQPFLAAVRNEPDMAAFVADVFVTNNSSVLNRVIEHALQFK
ncbi:hypothetical protein [Hymenobacter volaticus]|uniref:DUF4476 domain-containing protein n=1 Tax=Hymenobacter volaticus TaxID=2932254 RepID=A0ABY4G307_9BACT|nr:hypothetical protein [Hymenobacter volaticus]UOQ65156.1 hypothetical protein MUN86_16560 [Hymenobacter volaticus]